MSPSKSAAQPEPRPLAGEILFEEGDFHALSPGLDRDGQYNDRRLVARRKLLALGKGSVKEAKALGLGLECRTSLHNPNSFNGMKVSRLWAYLTRPKAEKARLKRTIGAELAKDLNQAYKNAYLCLAIEAEAFEVSLRIHPEGWYDGQNMVNRLKREGLEPWRDLLNALPGFQLRMHDWKGEWRCGDLGVQKLEEFLGYYIPGEHRLSVERRWPAPRGARGHCFEAGAVHELQNALLSLLPLYRFSAWSEESDFLFGG
ncbi:MAG: hypothetical protein ACI8QS_001397 [Planctomycetota bacterium]|jgi:hypothetical protein